MKKLFLAIIATVLFFSCEKSPLPNENLVSDLEAANLELSPNLPNDQLKASADANGGAQVIRYDGEWGFRFTDDETQIHAFINVKFEELCYSDRERSIVDIQDVLINEKDGTERIITLWKGQDVIVNVYESSYSTCEEYENAEPVYSGVGDFIWTDNNFNLVEDGDKNSVGFRLHGDGISIIYSLTYNGETIKSKTKINLK